MDLQQKFGQRILTLLEEKNISQGEFAEKIGCSRQSVNFYILGKRSPDIVLAAKMAEYLGVSCDYLIGFSDFRQDIEGNVTARNIGLSEDTMKFFAGLKIMATQSINGEQEKQEAMGFNYEKEILPYNRYHSSVTLKLLNDLIAHDSFGILLQYIKRYRDICHGEEEMAILKDFMLELESPLTGKRYGTKEENKKMMEEFCLHVVSKYLNNIVIDIASI